MKIIAESVEETIIIGEKLGALVNSGDILCLVGDLGTGKTHFVKGLAKGLKIEDYITSPTFTIVNEYQGRLKLYHFDVYRVDDPDEIYAIGFDEYIFSSAVSIIEWANFIEELIPEESITINITKVPTKGDNYREIDISYKGERYNYVREMSIC